MDSEVDSSLVFSSTTEFLKQLGSRTMSMLRGGGVAQESAVPRQFRNRHSSGEGDDMDMEVDEETAAAAPAQADADGHESESDAEKSDGEESKTKVRRMLIS